MKFAKFPLKKGESQKKAFLPLGTGRRRVILFYSSQIERKGVNETSPIVAPLLEGMVP